MFGKSKKAEDGEEPMKFGFVPQQMKNKNKEEAEEMPKHNTITKMFKNAPPPKKNLKQRPIDEISNQEEDKKSTISQSKQKLKIEIEKSEEELKVPETKNNLSKYRYSGAKALNESSIDHPKPVKTNFGISNTDNIVKA